MNVYINYPDEKEEIEEMIEEGLIEKDKKKVTKREHGFGVSAIPMSASMNYRLEDKDYVKHCDDIASVVIPLKDEK